MATYESIDSRNPDSFFSKSWGSLRPATDEIKAKETVLYPAYGPSKSGYAENGQRFLVLPGHGLPKTSCGEIRYGSACSNEECEEHEHLHLYHEHCDRLICPTCRDKAVRRAARRVCERVEGMKEAYEREGVKFGPLDHVEFSPPQDKFSLELVNTLEGYRRVHMAAIKFLRKYVYKLAGVYFFHPWRFKHKDGKTCEDPECKEVHIPVFSPHFHFTGYGFWKKSDDVYKESGWVYKKISPGQTRDLYNTVSYELSHAGVMMEAQLTYDSVSHMPVEGTLEFHQVSQVPRYVGMFSNSKGGFKETGREWSVELCEKCKSEVHEYDLDLDREGKLVPIQDRGPHEVLTIVGEWYLSKRKSRQLSVDGG